MYSKSSIVCRCHNDVLTTTFTFIVLTFTSIKMNRIISIFAPWNREINILSKEICLKTVAKFADFYDILNK